MMDDQGNLILTEEEQRLVRVLRATLEEKRRIPEEQHQADHEWSQRWRLRMAWCHQYIVRPVVGAIAVAAALWATSKIVRFFGDIGGAVLDNLPGGTP